jgi:hypothetical protein
VSSVNSVLDIDLSLSDQIPYNLKEGKLFYFSLYHYLSEEFGLEYYLIPNSSNFEAPNINGGFAKEREEDLFGGADLFSESHAGVEEKTRLIKELPKTDYFILLKGEDLHLFRFKIMDRLKSVSSFLQVQNIEPRDLPSRMNLVF